MKNINQSILIIILLPLIIIPSIALGVAAGYAINKSEKAPDKAITSSQTEKTGNLFQITQQEAYTTTPSENSPQSFIYQNTNEFEDITDFSQTNNLYDNGYRPTYDDVKEAQLINENNYSYLMLSPDDRIIYNEIWYGVTNRTEDVILSTNSKDVVDIAFQSFMNDHPEIYYVDGYKLSSYTLPASNLSAELIFNANYTKTEEECAEYERKIALYVDDYMNYSAGGASDYEYTKSAFDYVCIRTEYDREVPENQSILSPILYGKGVCIGYAKTMQVLLNERNIQSSIITGNAKDGSGNIVPHAWLIVNIDGDYYYCDPTWSDASAFKENNNVSYAYFNITTADLLSDHEIDNVVYAMNCTSTEENYYINEGKYLSSGDLKTQMDDIITRAKANGEGHVTVKCDNDYVYQNLYREMISNKGLLDYANGNQIQYLVNDSLRLFMVTF